MKTNLLEKYCTLKERIQYSYEDRIIPKKDYEQFEKELNLLFPYLKYSQLQNINIHADLLQNKLEILNQKLTKIIMKK